MARWFDVFCEQGAFDEAQTRKLLTAARDAGFQLRLHANQLTQSGAAALAVEFDCASADHCTHLSDGDVSRLAQSETVVTLLPVAEFSTRSKYLRARLAARRPCVGPIWGTWASARGRISSCSLRNRIFTWPTGPASI